MVISSLVVETLPGATERVASALARVEGVEVVQTLGRKVVVVVEAPTLTDSHRVASGFVGVDGVLNIGLAYANFEDDPTLVRGRA